MTVLSGVALELFQQQHLGLMLILMLSIRRASFDKGSKLERAVPTVVKQRWKRPERDEGGEKAEANQQLTWSTAGWV